MDSRHHEVPWLLLWTDRSLPDACSVRVSLLRSAPAPALGGFTAALLGRLLVIASLQHWLYSSPSTLLSHFLRTGSALSPHCPSVLFPWVRLEVS